MNFVKIFLNSMAEVHTQGLISNLIAASREKSIKSYKNVNVEVDQRTSNNRLIYLLQNQYHTK